MWGTYKKRSKDLLSNYRELIEKYWDYSKNTDMPEEVSIKSQKKYWWKDETGSFQLKPIELMRKDQGTSQPEQSIRFYLTKIFGDVKNRKKIRLGGVLCEADIYIEKYNIAIEYDGVFWHKDKFESDLLKSKLFYENGVFLIRVRENGLPPINEYGVKNIYCDCKGIGLHNTINEIVRCVGLGCELEEEDFYAVKQFSLTEEELINDTNRILDQYRLSYIENNITKSCLIKYWDYDKNNGIIPQKISDKDDINVWLTCKYGFSEKVNVKELCDGTKTKCEKNLNCSTCESFYCPLWRKCVKLHEWEDYYDYKSVFINACPAIKRHLYNKIFIEGGLADGYKSHFYYRSFMPEGVAVDYERQIGKTIEKHEDDFYNIEQIYKRHENCLRNDKELLSTTKKCFDSVFINKERFNNHKESLYFLYHYTPWIRDINYCDFDSCEEDRNFILKILDTFSVWAHRWEEYKGKISDNFFSAIKERASRHSIELSTSIFTLSELKEKIDNYNPRISNIVFEDMCSTSEGVSILLECVKRLPYFSRVFCSGAYRDVTKREEKIYDDLKSLGCLKEVVLNDDNIFDYIDLDWRQRKNQGCFGVIFKTKIKNSFTKIDSLEIDYKEEIKQTYLKGRKITAKTVWNPQMFGFQEEICVGGGKKNPRYVECPLVMKNIKGSVFLFTPSPNIIR